MKFAKKKNTLNCDKSCMNLYIVTFTKHCKFQYKNETTLMYNRLVCRGSKITQLIRNMKTYINFDNARNTKCFSNKLKCIAKCIYRSHKMCYNNIKCLLETANR